MSTAMDGDAPAPTVETQPPVETPATDEQQKMVKERKPRSPRQKKPMESKTVAHPPYFQMIKEAIMALNEKGGSSPYAIAKYMEDKHKSVLPANFRKMLALQLKNSASKGKLIKIKASYKLSEAGKKDVASKMEKKTTKKPKEKKKAKVAAAAAPAKAKPTRKTEKTKKVKLTKTKKTKSVAAKPKQPKSIKSPAAKRAKRASAN